MVFDITPGVSDLRLNNTDPSSGPLQAPDEGPQLSVEDNEDADIFRGEPPPRVPSPMSIAPSSSSSGSSLLGGRFTAIAAVVELAISRWARATSSSSSISSDNSSIRSSVLTLSRPRTGRRRRRPSSTSRSLQSAPDLAAKYRAREQSRHIPREFVLYLPPSLDSRAPIISAVRAGTEHQTLPKRTSSLSSILGQLDTALKEYAKPRRAHRSRPMSPDWVPPMPASHQDYMSPHPILLPNGPASFTDQGMFRTTRKGKGKERWTAHPQIPSPMSIPSEFGTFNRVPKAWWLDISSPSWEDLRAIGKLLHLHPLTLEDILQQDFREKLELFPKLGYYFVSFRAIESQATRELFRQFDTSTVDHNRYRDWGVVGEVNVYLVVFREGVCTFHFTDIAEHTDRVRNRLTNFESHNMSSDWVAHGILDSVVDSFFPFLEEVEKEVLEVERIVFSVDHERGQSFKPKSVMTVPKNSLQTDSEMKGNRLEKRVLMEEKYQPPSGAMNTIRTRFALPRPTFPLFLRRLKRTSLSISIFPRTSAEVRKTASSSTLHRISRARRLVTSLTHLLATKSDVVAQIRKRLLTTGPSGLGNGAEAHDVELAIYMGDVQDHILTLQHSLAHYERMLSQSHTSYLSQLRLTAVKTKLVQDKAIMPLTIISIAVVCLQILIGVVSMNVNVPTNVKDPSGRYNGFGIVLTLVFLILGVYLWFVRRWWLQAKAKTGRSAVL